MLGIVVGCWNIMNHPYVHRSRSTPWKLCECVALYTKTRYAWARTRTHSHTTARWTNNNMYRCSSPRPFGFGGVRQYAGLLQKPLVFAYTAHAARALSFCGCYTSTRELFKNIYVLQKVEFRRVFLKKNWITPMYIDHDRLPETCANV